jgi:pimeloyl-ACP methyl ester carboxylesterase
MPEPKEHQLQTNGINLTYFEWGDPEAEPVLLIHATGFHARCWDRVVAELGDGFHVYAVDMRGHGRSDKIPPYVWESFAADLSGLIEHLELHAAIGVGHSMGGHALVQVAAGHPGAFKRLLLVDPVIFDPEAYAHDRYKGFESAEDHPVSKRKNDWRDWQEMYERFKDRGSFALWDDEVLKDYCRYGIAERPDGRFELACPPLVESSIYLGNTGTNVYGLIDKVDVPVLVLRAKTRDPNESQIMDFSLSPTWPDVAARFPQGEDVYLPELTHFIPMQAPAFVAAFIRGERPDRG